jgi:hypothetical protein
MNKILNNPCAEKNISYCLRYMLNNLLFLSGHL